MSKIMPFLSLLFAAVIVAFGLGVYVTEFKVGPYRSIASGAKTLLYSYKGFKAPPYVGQFLRPVPGLSADQLADARFSGAPAGFAAPGTLLIIGGLNEYLEICPGDGCIAVEVDREGNILHGYPYLPDAIFAADNTNGSFYREAQPADPRQIQRPIGMQSLPGGDILVSFQSTGSMFPYSGGIARLDRDGNPRWFRFDYSHHWVNLSPDGQQILIPDLEIGTGNWEVPVGPTQRVMDEFCETDRPMIDGVHILDLNGEVMRRYDVNTALRESPWVSIMVDPFNACDPLHLNFVDMLDDTASGADLASGDLIVSSRNLSAILVMDPDSGAIKRIVKGSFQQQHSVQHLSGSKVLVFDNWGASGAGQGSRLLEVDLAGGPERQIFPAPRAPAQPDLYSARAGHLHISADRSRATISFTEAGVGLEVDLETGEELLRFNSLHDLSSVEAATEQQKKGVVRAKLFGIYHIEP